jgi:hypothetical protein
MPGTRKTRKDRSLSVKMGTDIFGPTDVNTMVVDQDETAEVSIISLGRSAMTNVTRHVHPAPLMMPSSHVSVGVTGSTPMPKKSVDHNVNVLRVDIGCTAGLNISRLSTTSRSQLKIPCLSLWIVMMVCFLFLCQPAVAAPSHAPTLTVYALNANGFVSLAKIHHMNNVIRSRRPHVFVISETKTSAKMGSKLSSLGYNVYEETGVCCTNHHISKWGIILGVRSDIQVSQPVKISSASLTGRVVAVDIILGTTAGKGFIHRIIGAYAPWNPGVDDGDFWMQTAKVCQS